MIKFSYTTCARESNRAINILRTKALWVYYMLGRPKYLESRWRFIVKLLKNFKLYLRTKIVGVLPWKIFYKWKRQNIDAWIKACINLANIFIKYLNVSATNLDALSQANWMPHAWPNKEFVCDTTETWSHSQVTHTTTCALEQGVRTLVDIRFRQYK